MKKVWDLVDGVVLLDKPQGVTSNEALQIVRRALNAKKAGHTGTLDPMATGLLPLCFGNATKFSMDLLNADKTYVARVRLGETTDTGDAEGRVIATAKVEVTHEALQEAARAFVGEIDQVPPMYSALKRNGECLYEIARRGETVEREARRVTIRSLAIEDFDGRDFTMTCTVSKGTYIRVLAEDIGKRLGCGAHLIALRRTAAGPITGEAMVPMAAFVAAREANDLQAARALMHPVDALLATLPRVELSAEESERFLHGQRLKTDRSMDDATVRVYDASTQRFLGTARVGRTGVLAPVRLVA